jgi:dCMP deaminase
MNALLNATVPVKNSRLYVSLFPCSNCAKLIAQSRVDEIIYSNDKYENTDDNLISKNILKTSGVKVRKIEELEIKVSTKK